VTFPIAKFDQNVINCCTDSGNPIPAVVVTGAWVPHVMSLMDHYAPVYPLKGYSMSVSANYILITSPLQSRDLPSRIVCDKYMYTTRLGDEEIRITSIGEFSFSRADEVKNRVTLCNDNNKISHPLDEQHV
jgi:hypothetical protein